MRDVHKLQHDIDNDPIITNQMDNFGCLLARTFVNFPAFVLVAVHTTPAYEYESEGSQNE